jgi:hypothetical protein
VGTLVAPESEISAQLSADNVPAAELELVQYASVRDVLFEIAQGCYGLVTVRLPIAGLRFCSLASKRKARGETWGEALKPLNERMMLMPFFRSKSRVVRAAALFAVCAAMTGAATQLSASGAPTTLVPGDLLVATSTFQNDPNIVAGTTELPPGCNPSTTKPKPPDPCGTAVENGDYPLVFNNDTIDGSFGVTSKIVLDQLTPSGTPVSTIEVPNSTDPGVTSNSDQMVTSFSSKSELALNLSTEGKYLTFMGYNAAVDTADVSNANTPGQIDPTSVDPGAYYRVVAELGTDGAFHFTETNAYTGDNGRAAISNDAAGLFYAAGNAGNGQNPPAEGVVTGAGAQLIQPSTLPESAQNPPGSLLDTPPSYPTPVGSFNITQLGYPADKLSKDNNYRGMTVFNNVLYYTKGSGGNGIDTVYFVDTTGKACPSGGVGLPEPGAPLPTASDFSFVANLGGAKPTKRRSLVFHRRTCAS